MARSPLASENASTNRPLNSAPRYLTWNLFFLSGSLALVALVAGLGWWLSRPVPLAPPIPGEVKDPEILRVIEQARQQVLHHPTAGNWGFLGNVLMAHLFDPEADRCYEEAHRLDPGDSRWTYFRGIIALKRRPDQATDFLRQAVESNTWPEYQFAMRIKLVEALLDRNQLDEAEPLLLHEIPSGKEAARVDMDLGWLAMARGQIQRAQENFSRARTSPYARKKATSQLVALARLSNNKADAERYEKEVTRLDEDLSWPDPVLEEIFKLRVGRRFEQLKINLLEQNHHYAEAAEMYQRRLQTEPTLQNYLGAGLNLARTKDYEQSLPLLREAVRLDPTSAEAHYTLALMLFRRAEEKQWQFPQTRENDPAFREVVQHATLATRLKPNYALAYLIWGLALKYLGQPEEALVPLRQGVGYRSDSIELHLALAGVLVDLRQDAEAERHLDNATRLDANDLRLAPLRQRLLANKSKR
jgi:tetratricopeptide (TPR) repeat protein